MNHAVRAVQVFGDDTGGQAEVGVVGAADNFFFGLVGEEAMGKGPMEYAGVKRSIVIKGHKTSVTLEDGFWSGLKEIAREKGYTLSGLVAQIDSERTGSNLSSAIRMYVLEYFKGFSEKSPPQ